MNESRKLFDEWHDWGCGFELHLSEDETQAFLTIIPTEPVHLEPEKIIEFLDEHEIIIGHHHDRIAEASVLLSEGKHVIDLMAAEGTSPKPTISAGISFSVHISTTTPDYSETENHEIDYHQANLFENVGPDQLIGFYNHEQEGTPGISVRGNTLEVSPPDSKPMPEAGDGVEIREENQFFATKEGRVVFENNKLSISDELIIDGDVDYETGDIDFVGSVHVRRSIRPGFIVRAKKGLIIDHIAENTHIESDGDIKIGGVAGDGTKGTIRCGGNLFARYLHEAQVECDGDIAVTSEATNCTLKCNGKLTAALLAGGTALVQQGIEVNRLGADSGVRTYVRAGEDFRHIENLDRIHKHLNVAMQHRRELREQKESAEPEILEELTSRLDALQEEIDSLKEEREQINKLTRNNQNAKVNIRKALFEGVTIRLGQTQELFREYRSGSYSVIEHKNQTLKLLHYSPLEIKAEELERDLICCEELEKKDH